MPSRFNIAGQAAHRSHFDRSQTSVCVSEADRFGRSRSSDTVISERHAMRSGSVGPWRFSPFISAIATLKDDAHLNKHGESRLTHRAIFGTPAQVATTYPTWVYLPTQGCV